MATTAPVNNSCIPFCLVISCIDSGCLLASWYIILRYSINILWFPLLFIAGDLIACKLLGWKFYCMNFESLGWWCPHLLSSAAVLRLVSILTSQFQHVACFILYRKITDLFPVFCESQESPELVAFSSGKSFLLGFADDFLSSVVSYFSFRNSDSSLSGLVLFKLFSCLFSNCSRTNLDLNF